MPVIVYVSRCAVMQLQQQLLLSLMACASSHHRMRLESATDLSESVKAVNKGSGPRYDTMHYIYVHPKAVE